MQHEILAPKLWLRQGVGNKDSFIQIRKRESDSGERQTGSPSFFCFLQGGCELTLRARLTFNPAAPQPARSEFGPATLGFEIPMYNVSSLQVRFFMYNTIEYRRILIRPILGHFGCCWLPGSASLRFISRRV